MSSPLFAGQFDVLSAGPGSNAIKLRNYAQPRFFLAITGGYLIGYVSGPTQRCRHVGPSKVEAL